MKILPVVMVVTALVSFEVDAIAGLFSSHFPKEGMKVDELDELSVAPAATSVGRDKDLQRMRASTFGFVGDADLREELDRILRKLMEGSQISGEPPVVRVLGNPTFTAQASSDANIYIDIQLLHELKSEDEVAGLLAHELAHIVLKHESDDAIEHTQRQLLHASKLATRVGEAVSLERDEDNEVDAKRVRLQEQNALLELSSQVVLPRRNRGQEIEADILAVDLVTKAGYSYVGIVDLLDVLERVNAMEASRREILNAGLELAHEGLLQRRNGTFDAKDFSLKNWSKLREALLPELDETHPHIEKRREEVSKYTDRPEFADTTEPDAVDWEAIKTDGGTGMTFRRYAEALEARTALHEGNLETAEAMARVATRAPTSDHAYPRFVFAMLRLRQGEQKKAEQNLQISLRRVEQGGRIHLEAARLAAGRGEPDEAAKIMQRAYEHFGEPPMLLPELIGYYRMAGEEDAMHAALATCRLDATAAPACEASAEAEVEVAEVPSADPEPASEDGEAEEDRERGTPSLVSGLGLGGLRIR